MSEKEGIPYLSYCAEVPCLAMFSRNIENQCNCFFVADSALAEEFPLRGSKKGLLPAVGTCSFC